MDYAPFEARVFNQDYELRWVADAQIFDVSKCDNTGAAVVLTEMKTDIWNTQEEDNTTVYMDVRLDQYALWGMYEKDDGNDMVFFEHRMGELKVPKDAFVWGMPTQGNVAALKIKEYIAVGDDHGSCAVIAERLLGFDVFPEK